MLEHGTDPNYQYSKQYIKLLHLAVAERHIAVVSVLVEINANIEASA